MFNPLKLTLRIKIIAAIILALLLSFLFIKPKENDIPVIPIALRLELTQLQDNSLELRNIAIADLYSPDYQTDLQSDYYQFTIKKGNNTLFTGKMPKKTVIIHEWIGENPRNDIEEQALGDFVLLLPYYEEATNIDFVDDAGNNVLSVDLTSKNLVKPKYKNTCEDGVCTDNENLLMCYSDCKYLLPKWMPK